LSRSPWLQYSVIISMGPGVVTGNGFKIIFQFVGDEHERKYTQRNPDIIMWLRSLVSLHLCHGFGFTLISKSSSPP